MYKMKLIVKIKRVDDTSIKYDINVDGTDDMITPEEWVSYSIDVLPARFENALNWKEWSPSVISGVEVSAVLHDDHLEYNVFEINHILSKLNDSSSTSYVSTSFGDSSGSVDGTHRSETIPTPDSPFNYVTEDVWKRVVIAIISHIRK